MIFRAKPDPPPENAAERSEDLSRALRGGAAGLTWRRYRMAAGRTGTFEHAEGRLVNVTTMRTSPPSWENIRKGQQVAQDLRELGVEKILIAAAEAGYITEKKCGMEHCFALGGRGWFVQVRAVGVKRSPWEPTHEHAPLPKWRGGIREIENAVLAHRRCNNVGHKLEALKDHLERTLRPDGRSLDSRAIEIAIHEHVAERYTRLGRNPRRRGSWRTARAVAQRAHENLHPPSTGSSPEP